MLAAAPSEMEIDFLPDGAKLSDHISDAEILYGVVSRGCSSACEISAVGDAAVCRSRAVDVSCLQGESHHTDKQQASVWTAAC